MTERYGDLAKTFGIEAEYMVMSSDHAKVHSWRDLKFEIFEEIFNSIRFEDVGTVEEMKPYPPHSRKTPFILEGYHLPDFNENCRDILIKGIEIRTPVKLTVQKSISALFELKKRLDASLENNGFALAAISHHPFETRFEAPQGERSEHFWQWSKQAMLTYGPDFNIGLDSSFHQRQNWGDFDRKMNAYAAAMAAFSLASPYYDGGWFMVDGKHALSARTYKRCLVAPTYKLHPGQNHRIEFKLFDMPRKAVEFEAYFLLCLTLLFSEKLVARSDASSGIDALRRTARFGFHIEETLVKAEALYEEAVKIAPYFDIGESALKLLEDRMVNRSTPADELIMGVGNNQKSRRFHTL